MAQLPDASMSITFRPEFRGATYEERLDECLDVVKDAIKAAPKGAEFKIIKTESGSTLGTDPLMVLEMKVGLR